MKYADKLKDPRWQKKRLEILERDKWMCRACGDKEKTLHVHHIFYLPNTDPWDIPSGLLVTFCCDCHNPGPCDDSYKSCKECPHHKDSSCEGPGTHAHDLAAHVGRLLDCLWRNSELYGGHDYHTILTNAYYMAKPE